MYSDSYEGVFFGQHYLCSSTLKRVAEVYKQFYTKDFRGLIEPFVQPEDVK